MIPTHDTFTITRHFTASPAKVFACWSDPVKKRRWFADNGGPEWETLDYALDFRVGGHEYGRFQFNGAPDAPMAGLHENETVYLDIVPDARIVTACSMAMNGVRHSASLGTTTLTADGDGCRMVYTEQITLLAPSDGAEGRKHGTDWLFDQLEKELTG